MFSAFKAQHHPDNVLAVVGDEQHSTSLTKAAVRALCSPGFDETLKGRRGSQDHMTSSPFFLVDDRTFLVRGLSSSCVPESLGWDRGCAGGGWT